MKKNIYVLLSVLAVCLTVYANVAHATPNGIPVLMYHEIIPDNVSTPPGDTVVTISKFNKQMKWLRLNNYCSISIEDLIKYMRGKNPYIGFSKFSRGRVCNPIVLTFDDGWKNQINALPALGVNNFQGTFFIIGSYPDTNNSSYMNWAEIKHLTKIGHNLGSHSMTHISNMTLSDAPYEIATSKSYIESKTHERVTALAWPNGYYTTDLLNYAENIAHYQGSVSVDDNWCYSSNISLEGTPYCDWHTGNSINDDEFKIKRIFVDGRCSIGEFGKIVKQGHTMQCFGDGADMDSPAIMRVPVNPINSPNVNSPRNSVDVLNRGLTE